MPLAAEPEARMGTSSRGLLDQLLERPDVIRNASFNSRSDFRLSCARSSQRDIYVVSELAARAAGRHLQRGDLGRGGEGVSGFHAVLFAGGSSSPSVQEDLPFASLLVVRG